MSTAVSPSSLPRQSAWADAQELLASMRFAIALLTIICVASAIGTVLKQGEPLVNYVDAFGPFWAEVFSALGLFRVYSSGWFLLILAFLVVSTSLCIARNVPKILADLRTFKENIREQALGAFHHKAQGRVDAPLAVARDQVLGTLGQQGWQLKTQERTGESGAQPGVMIAARRGTANKLGYIAAHSAIVLVCLGGLFDGDMIAKAQAWWFHLEPYKSGEVLDKHKLSLSNPAYRAQLMVAEGQRSSSAVLSLDQGMLLQPLPFEVELKKFIVDYYATGMPKRFASEIVVHDPRDQSSHAATVEVNKPFIYDGITIFQSSFEDGGSLVRLKPVSLGARAAQSTAVLSGVVGGEGQMLPRELTGGEALSLELTSLRVINVEDLAAADKQRQDGQGTTDVRGVNLQDLTRHLGSGARAPGGDKRLTNIGPSVTYKLRDAAGQAREFQNYMVPVMLDGQAVFLLGVRNTLAESFRFLRVPADENMQITGWWRLRQALSDPALRQEAARRFAVRGASADRPELIGQLQVSSQRVLDLFSGAQAVPGVAAGAPPMAGFEALSEFINRVVPPAEQEHTSATLIRILNGSLFELLNLARERAGLPALSADEEATRSFMTQSVMSLSDAQHYPAPLILMPESFEQRQASVFQVTRTPGRNVVYLGCALLIIGVFAMLYVRERRVWVWLQTDASGGTAVKMALSSTRQTLDTDHEFDRLRQAIVPAAAAPAVTDRTPT
ncbi:MAG TPA: cytochrome c biogenesis protein ResB [Aquabacterium sp.]|uniref:cytochrome c biogenesis protein ResB n=1 Tax=Aquabacterium sp. TaxID=1872578 RepID=UPI002E365559|nr:cytochrome c biogenesis protein ResB [Aquabacterium sp.]HEX5373773.1 cytochrome c biogenesis protein ResB [Aquabacterium sp.]